MDRLCKSSSFTGKSKYSEPDEKNKANGYFITDEEKKDYDDKIKQLESEIYNQRLQFDRDKKTIIDDCKREVATIKEQLFDSQQEVQKEKDLNSNLKRIARERANKQNGIKNKKKSLGYYIIACKESVFRYKYNNYTYNLDCYVSTFITPVSVCMGDEEAKNFVKGDLNKLLEMIGFKKFNGNIQELKKADDRLVFKYTFNRDFVKKCYKINLYHNKPLGQVPVDLLPPDIPKKPLEIAHPGGKL